jgi:hypothetical protein
MDEKLEKALEFSNYQKTLHLQKENLKLRLEHMLLVKFDNNIFSCSIELINFMQTCISNNIESVVILNNYGDPVKVDQLRDCLDLFLGKYNTAYNEYFEKYEALKKARNVKKVVT